MEKRGADHIMAIAENVCSYLEETTHDAFDRVTPAIALRVDRFDDDPVVRRPCGMLCDGSRGLLGGRNLFALASG
jgi:hypothetical protein